MNTKEEHLILTKGKNAIIQLGILQLGLLKMKQTLYFIFSFGKLYSEGLDFLMDLPKLV